MMVHRYWEGVPDPTATWTANAIASTQAGSTLHDWTPDDVPNVEVDEAQVAPRDRVRHRSNVIRYALLERFGGLWLDHDVIPLRDLGEGAWTAAVGQSRGGCAMHFPAHHPFLHWLLDFIDHLPASNLPAWRVSGGMALDRVPVGAGRRQDVCPFDSTGFRLPGVEPSAVHLWTSSRPGLASSGMSPSGRRRPHG